METSPPSSAPSPSLMNAATCRRYGGPEVIALERLPKPSPRKGELLVRVRACTVTAADWRLRAAHTPRGFGPFLRLVMGLRRPRRPVLGSELAGVVEAVGDGVSGFQTGDRVFALTGMALGAHAEFCLVKADGAVAHSPPNLSDREVAPLAWAGGTALYFLRDLGQLRRGERALIIGAAGGVGSAAVQIAAHLGAQVTGVCRGDNAALVRDLGAHAIIDYERESFQNLAARYDLILDTVGECSWSNSRGALAPGGRLLLAVADLWQTLGAVIWPRRAGQQVRAGTTPERADDLRLLAQWASEGALRPHIDRVLPLSEIAQAHALVESRRKRGHIIIEP